MDKRLCNIAMRAIKPIGNRNIVSLEAAAADIASYNPPQDTPPTENPPAPAIEPEATTISIPSAGSVNYKNLLWEPLAYREQGKTDKRLLSYDKSLERLSAVGYARHPSPAEMMSLLIDGLEGKLDAAEQAIYDDMLTSYGEWTNVAFNVKQAAGNLILEVYENVKGLVWDREKYVKQNFKHTGKREFDITNIQLQTYVDLNQFPDDLVQYLYTRSFAALPKKMKEGSQKAQLYLPLPNTLWSVGHGNFGDRFYFGRGSFGASRGVNAATQKN